MSSTATDTGAMQRRSALPTVTIVLLVYNRRNELRRTLTEMLEGSDYDSDLIDVVVVDNASEDGSAEMVHAEFPQARVIRREVNCGISGWNDGFALATGDLVLVLDDDCYLPGDRLRRAVESMEEHEADMVSFSVVAADYPEHRFDHDYKTGLLTFWGCAALVRRSALNEVGGFDPEIFLWAHEVEFMVRFYDKGFRHLHLPEVSAIHMKDPHAALEWRYYGSPTYRFNARNFGYVAAKHLRARDAFEALVALLATNVRHWIRIDLAPLSVVSDTLAGFARGLKNREPVRNRELSRAYRRNFYDFASPWWFSRPLREWVRPRDPDSPPRGREDEFFERRARYYPTSAATLDFPTA
jgi:GT2 family glycosyltransferase